MHSELDFTVSTYRKQISNRLMAEDRAVASAYSTCCRYRAYAIEYEALVYAPRSDWNQITVRPPGAYVRDTTFNRNEEPLLELST